MDVGLALGKVVCKIVWAIMYGCSRTMQIKIHFMELVVDIKTIKVSTVFFQRVVEKKVSFALCKMQLL